MGSCGTALTRGFQYYLKYFLNAHVSWDGNQLGTVKLPFPKANIEIKSPNQFIYYQNVCTHSYSFAFWTWKEWQKHLDWMALQGINFFIAPVQEEIWTRVYKKLNMTNEEIDDHISGWGFLAWQRMGNIRGWGGPLTDNFKKFALGLQKQIINFARDLGMVVALPAFAGHAPRAFQRIFPNASYFRTSQWVNFQDQYCCPLFMDPRGKEYKQVAKMFLKEVIKEYGTDHIYFADPYNELAPESNDVAYLRNVSRGIYKGMQAVDKDAIWLTQGWQFLSWQKSTIEAFVTAVDIGKMLILDLNSESWPLYTVTKSYFGQPYIWCMLHNFGGTLGMFGRLEVLNTVSLFFSRYN